MQLKKFDLIYFFVIVVIIAGIIIRTKLLFLNPSYWYDTCSLASNLDKNFFDFFKPLENMQVAPPLFMVMSKLICSIFPIENDIFYKDFVVRLFPFFCGILSLPLISVLTEKMFGNKYLTLICTFLLCFNPTAIYYSIEFKQYSCELLFAIILLLIFYMIDIKSISNKKLLIYSLIISLSIWFSIPALFIVFTGLLYIFAKMIKDKIFDKKKFLILFLPLFLNLLIFVFCFYIPVHQKYYAGMEWFWDNEYPSFFTSDNFFELFSHKVRNLVNLYRYIEFWPFMVLNFALIIYSKQIKNLYFILLPVFLIVCASALHQYPFENRLILFLLPLFLIFLSQIALFIPKNIVCSIFTVCILSLLIFKNMNIDISKYVMIKSYVRDSFIQLCELNPKLENIIGENLIYKYYSNQKPKIHDYMYGYFDKSPFAKNIENITEPGEYWLYAPYGHKIYQKDMKNYLEHSSRIKSIQYYEIKKERNSFIARLVIE